MTAQTIMIDRQRQHNIDVVQRFFDLLHQGDVEAWGKLWAEDARIIVFYPPQGFGESIDGRAEIVAGFQTLMGVFDTFDYELTGIYPAADSDAVCVEYRVRAKLVDGREYTNRNITVFRFQDGLISTYHDYFDPRRFQMVVDALPKP
jgi:ketosteroid isomerase-like protein